MPSTNEKEELEKKKLRLEIATLKKQWYKTPTNLFPMFTFLLAIGTLIWSISTGLLSVKEERLGNESVKLQNEIHDFRQTKDALMRQDSFLRNKADSLTQTIQNLNKQKDFLQDDLFKILAQKNTESQKVQALVSKLADLNKEYTKKINDTVSTLNGQWYSRVFDVAQKQDIYRFDAYDKQLALERCQREKELLQAKLNAFLKEEK